ncbi:5-formyltetrahydrofolate cyclo-ligase [Candidatus Peregrinibacteria bacterium CG_4_9_14_0_2_um_filter_41_14]|nr:MAG: 5-formyltetrahydrofolate cyclo-ligase [Candidatus Peregrinibacteria bacterium CG_4_9_14_0_2_um_filter_41_14]
MHSFKAQLRQQFLLMREAISESERTQKSKYIRVHLANLIEAQMSTSIGIYYPVRSEVNLLPLVEQNPQQFLFPITTADNTISFYQVSDLKDFKDGQFGIPEPIITNKQPQTPDCLIVPAIVFDLQGDRLGYGKGCYDRYLKEFQGVTIGVNYSECITSETLPTETFDQSVEYIITENGIQHTY